MAESVVYSLSSIDQSVHRSYIRVCLCYACSSDTDAVDEIVSRLNQSVTNAIQHFPILAGKVVSADTITNLDTPSSSRSAQKPRRESIESFSSSYHAGHARQQSSDENPFAVLGKHRRASAESGYGTEQRGRLEVHLTLDQVEKMKPITIAAESTDQMHSYEEMKKAGMPAELFIGNGQIFTPLPDLPDPAKGSNPVFAVQASFVDGGVVVMLYLHHSVADILGLGRVIQCMSSKRREQVPQERTLKSLQDNALETTRARDRLSGCRGFKADIASHSAYNVAKGRYRTLSTSLGTPSSGTCRAVSFDLRMINNITGMVNERLNTFSVPSGVKVSPLDCLIAILWKAIIRARWLYKPTEQGQASTLFMPVNIGKQIEPALPEEYFGNACLFSNASSLRTRLMLPFDVGTIAEVASLIHRSTASVDETKVRSAIALINELADVRVANYPKMDFEHDVFVTNWTKLPKGEDSTLGLGLGPADFIRQPGREPSSYGCIVLPAEAQRGVWEVLMQMEVEAMERLLRDPGLGSFVVSSA